MKPLGTITMYYPLVDDETREILDSLMHESENFYDFLIRLGDKVCSKVVSPSLVFIAVVWSWRMEVEETYERIAERYKNNPTIKPWTFPKGTPMEGDRLQTRMLKALDDAIASEPDDWVLLHLLLRKMTVILATPESQLAHEAAKNLLEKEPRLECFQPEIQYWEAQIRWYEGDNRGAMKCWIKVLEKAKQQDNQFLIVNLLLNLSGETYLTDYQKAMQFIDEAYSISKSLGIPRLIRSTLFRMSSISRTLGEYDLALNCLFDATELKPSIRSPHLHIPLDVSSIYSDLGKGKDALSWALMFDEEEYAGGRAGASAHGCPEIEKARALLLLGRTNDAFEHIDRLKDIAFKVGWEPYLADYYYVSGLYEIAIGETATGIQMIERALEIYERLAIQRSVNMCLLALTRAEIMEYEIDDSILDPRDSGPWMNRLEKEASEKRLPGILMQHALLKAEFRMKLKQTDVAREILEAALKISDQPTVKTLRRRILDQIEELEKISIS